MDGQTIREVFRCKKARSFLDKIYQEKARYMRDQLILIEDTIKTTNNTIMVSIVK